MVVLQGELAHRWCRRRLHVGSKDCTAPDALRKSRIPVLFIHGTDDKFVPVTMTYENYQACAAPKRLFIVPGAEHGMCYHIDRPFGERWWPIKGRPAEKVYKAWSILDRSR